MFGCIDELRSLRDLSLEVFKILDFVKFNCFFTSAQISELVFSSKDKQGSFFSLDFFSSAYAKACYIGSFPVVFFIP